MANLNERAELHKTIWKNERQTKIFRSIESSAIGTPLEDDLRGLFDDVTLDNSALGYTVIKRNQLLTRVLQTVSQMDYNDTNNDTFGDTYEFLMQIYASQAGKSDGEFFTPQQSSASSISSIPSRSCSQLRAITRSAREAIW